MHQLIIRILANILGNIRVVVVKHDISTNRFDILVVLPRGGRDDCVAACFSDLDKVLSYGRRARPYENL
jgi:hypothetical protein